VQEFVRAAGRPRPESDRGDEKSEERVRPPAPEDGVSGQPDENRERKIRTEDVLDAFLAACRPYASGGREESRDRPRPEVMSRTGRTVTTSFEARKVRVRPV
jgi:hypothetical protein